VKPPTNARRLGLIGLVILLALVARPLYTLWKGHAADKSAFPPQVAGTVDDVSRLNATPVDSVLHVAMDHDSAIAQLRALLAYARGNDLPVSIAGARHSMGGHTIAPHGVQVDMLPFKRMRLDTTDGVLTVGSGALWSEVIPFLNDHDRAVAVMQSDNAFSVGGSISVNCHGWQHNKPPIASTVRSFRLLRADGTIVECSRENDRELFSLALGGYGLFGIILEVDLWTVPNETYTFHRLVMSSENYLDNYARLIDADSTVRMVYGRLNVNESDFLRRAMLNYFTFDTLAAKNSPLTEPGLDELKRSIFLGTKGDDYGKRMRWNSEQAYTKMRIGTRITRNQVMHESPAVYMNRSADRTDILHEYFIPRARFNDFIDALRRIIPAHEQDLLNITIRNVYRDDDTYLRYADEEMFAFVLFYDQRMSPEAEADMGALTRELIDAALGLGGTYYLPYRLHATPDQLRRAYPMAEAFFALKSRYDTLGLFQNRFSTTYASPR
jgi:FAD/FMN-containing dehydrogenase